jgi:hypothetical protein
VLLRSLFDVVNGSPVQQLLRRRLRLRHQAPPGRQGGDPLRPCHGPGCSGRQPEVLTTPGGRTAKAAGWGRMARRAL